MSLVWYRGKIIELAALSCTVCLHRFNPDMYWMLFRRFSSPENINTIVMRFSVNEETSSSCNYSSDWHVDPQLCLQNKMIHCLNCVEWSSICLIEARRPSFIVYFIDCILCSTSPRLSASQPSFQSKMMKDPHWEEAAENISSSGDVSWRSWETCKWWVCWGPPGWW